MEQRSVAAAALYSANKELLLPDIFSKEAWILLELAKDRRERKKNSVSRKFSPLATRSYIAAVFHYRSWYDFQIIYAYSTTTEHKYRTLNREPILWEDIWRKCPPVGSSVQTQKSFSIWVLYLCRGIWLLSFYMKSFLPKRNKSKTIKIELGAGLGRYC